MALDFTDLLVPFFIIVFVLVPFIIIVVYIRGSIKKRHEKNVEDFERLGSRSFSLIDLYSYVYYDGEDSQVRLFPLIEDDDSHEKYIFEITPDTYFWQEYGEKKKGIYIDYHVLRKPTFSKNQEIVYNVAGGKYKVREEYGTVEVTGDDVIFHYYGEEQQGVLAKLASKHHIKDYKHYNDSHEFEDINNAKIIDCFINFDRF